MRNARTYVALLPVLLASLSSLAQEKPARPPVTVILCAFDAEATALNEAVTNPQERVFTGMRFITGELRGRHVAVAQTGIGKVNAAMVATAAILGFHPNEIVFSGIAGAISPSLQPGDIVIGATVAQHDYGFLGPDGFHCKPTDHYLGGHNPLFFTPDGTLLKCAEVVAAKIPLGEVVGKEGPHMPKVTKGVIVTGDVFIASSAKKTELIETLKADAVEMEGGAIAQVCHQLKVPFIIIRSISDNADENANIDLGQFYKVAATNSAKFVTELVASLK